MRLVLVIDRTPPSLRLPWESRIPADFSLELRSDAEVLARAPDLRPSVIVLPLATESASDVMEVAGSLRRAAPRVPIVAWCLEGSHLGSTVLRVARAGIEHFAFEQVDTLPDVLRMVTSRPARTGAALVREALAGLPPLAEQMLRRVVFSAAPISTVAGLGQAMGVSERTLLRRCAARGWPCPRTIVRHGSLIRGLLTLEETGEIELAARSAGYRSARVFRGALRGAVTLPRSVPATEAVTALLVVVRHHFSGAGVADAQSERTAEGGWRDERTQHRVHAAGRAELERPHAGVALGQVTKRAG